MTLPEKYELLDLIAENETRTFLARERASVRMVMVHLLLPGPDRISLLELVLRTRLIPTSPGRLQILDLGEHEGNPYVVTEIIPGFTTLRNWLEAELAYARTPRPAAPSSPPASEATPAVPRRDPGEFTQLFQVVMSGISDPGSARRQPAAPPPPEAPKTAPVQATPPPPAVPPTGIPSREPGEFTRMFQAGWSQPPAPPPPPGPSAPVSASTPPPPEPGEFTRMFQSPMVQAPPGPPANAPVLMAKPPEPPSGPQPGEFTRMFQQGLPAIQREPSPAAPGALPPPPEPGEFTRMFQSPLAPQPIETQPPLGLPSAGPSFPTPASGAPWSVPMAPAQPVQPTPDLSGGPGGSSAGEFTRLFGAPGAAPIPSAPLGGSDPGGATQLFSAAPAPPPPPAAISGGPGEFTRITAAAPFEPAQPAPAAPAPQSAPAPAARPANLPLWIIAGSILVIVILLVVYFLVRR